MEVSTSKIFEAAASGTQYAPSSSGSDVGRANDIGLTVDHPAATTTAYTVEASNLTADEIRRGLDDWHTYGSVTIGSKSAAEKFGVGLEDYEFKRFRLKMVTTVGSAVITVRMHAKG